MKLISQAIETWMVEHQGIIDSCKMKLNNFPHMKRADRRDFESQIEFSESIIHEGKQALKILNEGIRPKAIKP